MTDMENLVRKTVEQTTGVNRIAKSVGSLTENVATLDRDAFALASLLIKAQQKIINLQDELLGQYRRGDL